MDLGDPEGRAKVRGTASLGDFERVSQFLPQESTTLLYAFARANHPHHELFEAVAAPIDDQWRSGVAAVMASWTEQDVCNTMWALAASDSLHVSLIEACVYCLRYRLGAVDLGRVFRTQLQQWVIWWEVEMGRDASWMSDELRKKCRDSLAAGDIDTPGGHTTSRFQRKVSAALDRLGIGYHEEYVMAEGYSLDLAITGGPSELRVGIEVDGPHHFTQERTITGATQMKRRQLAALGWQLVSIPFFEWQEFKGSQQKEEEYLKNLLEPHGVTSASFSAASLDGAATNAGITGIGLWGAQVPYPPPVPNAVANVDPTAYAHLPFGQPLGPTQPGTMPSGLMPSAVGLSAVGSSAVGLGGVGALGAGPLGLGPFGGGSFAVGPAANNPSLDPRSRQDPRLQ